MLESPPATSAVQIDDADDILSTITTALKSPTLGLRSHSSSYGVFLLQDTEWPAYDFATFQKALERRERLQNREKTKGEKAFIVVDNDREADAETSSTRVEAIQQEEEWDVV